MKVRLGARVTAIDAARRCNAVAGRRQRRSCTIASRCVIWAAGVAASPLGGSSRRRPARVDRAGRVVVEPDLSVPGHPEISVIGDLAAARSYAPGRPGRCRASRRRPSRWDGTRPRNILAPAGGPADAALPLPRLRQPRHHRPQRRGGRPVSPLGRFKFSGYPAWLFWLFAHIYFLIGFRNRIVVLIDWASAYWSQQRYARVIADIDADAAATGRRSPADDPQRAGIHS